MISNGIAVVSGLGLALMAIVALFAAPLYRRWLERYPLFLTILIVVLAVMYGWIGGDLGVKNLFWHEERWVQAGAGISIGWLAIVLVLLAYLLEADRSIPAGYTGRVRRLVGGRVALWRGRPPMIMDRPEDDAGRLRTVIEAFSLPLLVAVWLPPVASSLVARWVDPNDPAGSDWWLPVGTTATLLAVDWVLRLPVANRWRPRAWHGWAAVLVPAAILYLAPALVPAMGRGADRWITAAMVICLLGTLAALLIYATYGRVLVRLLLLAALLVLQGLTNSNPYKLSYPGMDPYGTRQTRVSLRSEISPLRVASPAERTTREAIKEYDGVALYGALTYDIDSSPQEVELTRLRKSRLDELIARLAEAIQDDPRYAPAFYFHGVIEKRCGDRLLFYSEHPEQSIGRYESALADYTRAISLGVQTAEIHFQRGLVQERLRSVAPDRIPLEAIIADYREALARDSRSARIKVHLASALEQSGQPPDRDQADGLYLEAARQMIALHRAGIVRTPIEVSMPPPLIPTTPDANVPPPPPPPDQFVPLKEPGEPLDTYSGSPGFDHYLSALKLARDGNDPEAERAYCRALRTPSASTETRDRRSPLDQYTWHASFRTEAYTGLLDDQGVLNRWRAEREARNPGGPSKKPKLVIVSVSGGGIVAAAWTIRCLTEIRRQYPDFPYQVRIITGASGGMVGAGLYVAALESPDTKAQDDQWLREAIDRESLTPVVRRMLLRDLPSIFLPWLQATDRGRVLEETWIENSAHPVEGRTSSPLAKKFSDLRQGELEGWRPSLIVSPLLVENGAQIAISNLDLEHVRGINLHFHTIFPESYNRFPLSTALRMNAAFPVVTPAVNLPTVPPVRIADAGYVDNYGVRLAAEWLRQNVGWLAEHTSGVALVQIRAYPLGLTGREDADGQAVGSPAPGPAAGDPGEFSVTGGLQWLTTPIEGYTTARKMGMVSMNDALLEAVRGEFLGKVSNASGQMSGGNDRSGFLRTFVFENSEDVPLGWSLTRRDGRRLDEALRKVEPERQALVDYLTDRKPAAPNPADGGKVREPPRHPRHLLPRR